MWIRGILADHYGVPVESVRYRTGGLDAPGRHEKVAVSLPDSIDIAPIPDEKTLSQMDPRITVCTPGTYRTASVRTLPALEPVRRRRYYRRALGPKIWLKIRNQTGPRYQPAHQDDLDHLQN